MSNKIDRRTFIGTSSAITAAMVVPRHVLGGPAHVPPSEKTTIAFIGSSNLQALLTIPAHRSLGCQRRRSPCGHRRRHAGLDEVPGVLQLAPTPAKGIAIGVSVPSWLH